MRIVGAHDGCVRAELLTELHLSIQPILHAGYAWVTQNAAVTKRTRSMLSVPAHHSHNISGEKQLRDIGGSRLNCFEAPHSFPKITQVEYRWARISHLNRFLW